MAWAVPFLPNGLRSIVQDGFLCLLTAPMFVHVLSACPAGRPSLPWHVQVADAPSKAGWTLPAPEQLHAGFNGQTPTHGTDARVQSVAAKPKRKASTLRLSRRRKANRAEHRSSDDRPAAPSSPPQAFRQDLLLHGVAAATKTLSGLLNRHCCSMPSCVIRHGIALLDYRGQPLRVPAGRPGGFLYGGSSHLAVHGQLGAPVVV